MALFLRWTSTVNFATRLNLFFREKVPKLDAASACCCHLSVAKPLRGPFHEEAIAMQRWEGSLLQPALPRSTSCSPRRPSATSRILVRPPAPLLPSPLRPPKGAALVEERRLLGANPGNGTLAVSPLKSSVAFRAWLF